MNFSVRRHLVDLIPLFTLGGIFKVLIIPNWDNMTYTNPITVNPIMTALLVLGWSLVMAILYYWKKLHRKQDNKKLLDFINERMTMLLQKTTNNEYTKDAQSLACNSFSELKVIRDQLSEPKSKFWRFTK